jgi:hypothetical protein
MVTPCDVVAIYLNFGQTECLSTGQAERRKPQRKVSRTAQPGFPAYPEDRGGHSCVTLINFYQITRCEIADGESICSEGRNKGQEGRENYMMRSFVICVAFRV